MARLRSTLSEAKGHGSAKEGVHHWWIQRLTAIALAPLSVWLMASLLAVGRTHDPFVVADWLASPLHTALMAAIIIALFWHAKLGVQVIVEDYVHGKGLKYTLLIANNFICFGAALVSLISVLKLHMMHIVSGF